MSEWDEQWDEDKERAQSADERYREIGQARIRELRDQLAKGSG